MTSSSSFLLPMLCALVQTHFRWATGPATFFGAEALTPMGLFSGVSVVFNVNNPYLSAAVFITISYPHWDGEGALCIHTGTLQTCSSVLSPVWSGPKDLASTLTFKHWRTTGPAQVSSATVMRAVGSWRVSRLP